MINSSEFAFQWESEKLVYANQSVLDGIDFSTDTKNFLLQVGLPITEPEFDIDFARLVSDIPLLDSVLREDGIEPFLDVRYRVIGIENGRYGSYCCVQEGEENPLFYVYSLLQRSQFLNSSIFHFAEALLTYKTFRQKFVLSFRNDDMDEAERLVGQLAKDLKQIDPASMKYEPIQTETRDVYPFWCETVFHAWG